MHKESAVSLSAKERENPPSRRKSCGACVRAKRRCDFALPSCMRCAQRKVACHYPPRTSARQRTSAQQPPLPGDESEESCADVGLDYCTDDVGVLADFGDEEHAWFDDNVNPASLNKLGTSVSSMGRAYGVSELCRSDFALDKVDWSVFEQSTALTAPHSKSLNFELDAVRDRLQVSLDLIRCAPKTMATEMQTPWCHPLLYANNMPRSIQDAVSSCALYMSKNAVNSAVVFKIIEARVADLIAAPSPATLFDSLAETQALILYQIIRLFDGDIAARASGELLIPYLETAALNILTYVRFDTELADVEAMPLYPVREIREFWESWVLHETARRTVLLSFYLLQAYRVLVGYRGLTCDGKLGLCLSWTLSARLWEARTAVEFAQAARAKRYFVIENAKTFDWVDRARAEDVDVFGKIWISSLLGIQETEAWFASKGGCLREQTAVG